MFAETQSWGPEKLRPRSNINMIELNKLSKNLHKKINKWSIVRAPRISAKNLCAIPALSQSWYCSLVFLKSAYMLRSINRLSSQKWKFQSVTPTHHSHNLISHFLLLHLVREIQILDKLSTAQQQQQSRLWVSEWGKVNEWQGGKLKYVFKFINLKPRVLNTTYETGGC